MKNKKLNNKGISLISLIITVIVIIVLISITIRSGTTTGSAFWLAFMTIAFILIRVFMKEVLKSISQSKPIMNSNLANNTISKTSQIDVSQKQLAIKIRCACCGAPLKISDKKCNYCGSVIEGNNIEVVETDNTSESNVNQTIDVKYVSPSDYEPIYSKPEEAFLDEYIKMEFANNGVINSKKYLPKSLLKMKVMSKIFLSILVFIYSSMIFLHYPLMTYIIGAIILGVLFVLTQKFNLIKYAKKQLKARPNEKITNVILSIRQSLGYDKSNLILVGGVFLAVISSCLIFSSPRIIYEKIDGGYGVRYYAFGLKNYVTAEIPETYNGEKVISLRGNTFSNMPFLKSVKLPDSVVEIRGQAFLNCKSLEEVNMPKNLVYLGGEAFYNCSSLKSIYLPEGLQEIRGDTFEYCTSLRSINIPDSVTRIGGHAFYGDRLLSEVNISENSKLGEIGSSAFRQCSSLYKITLPSKTSVNSRAFKESPTTVMRYESK